MSSPAFRPSNTKLYRTAKPPFSGRIKHRKPNIPLETIQSIHALAMTGMPLRHACIHHGLMNPHTAKNIRQTFLRRGLPLPPVIINAGCFPAAPPLTEEEIETAILELTKFMVPAKIKNEWRDWSLERRAATIARIRQHLGIPKRRPPGPVIGAVPFEYGTPEAHALQAKLNEGRTSRDNVAKIRINSEGVIWRDQLWFWVEDNGYVKGPFDPKQGRRETIHRILWEEAHGPIPRSHVLRAIDGNPNHLRLENLILVTRNSVARENQAKFLREQSRARTRALLERNNRNLPTTPTTHEHTHTDTLGIILSRKPKKN